MECVFDASHHDIDNRHACHVSRARMNQAEEAREALSRLRTDAEALRQQVAEAKAELAKVSYPPIIGCPRSSDVPDHLMLPIMW